MAKERGAETTAAQAKARALFLTRERAARGTGTSASSAETTERERNKGIMVRGREGGRERKIEIEKSSSFVNNYCLF